MLLSGLGRSGRGISKGLMESFRISLVFAFTFFCFDLWSIDFDGVGQKINNCMINYEFHDCICVNKAKSFCTLNLTPIKKNLSVDTFCALQIYLFLLVPLQYQHLKQ